MKALNSLSEEKEVTIQNMELLKSMSCDITEITGEQEQLASELSLLTQQLQGLVQQNATVAKK